MVEMLDFLLPISDIPGLKLVHRSRIVTVYLRVFPVRLANVGARTDNLCPPFAHFKVPQHTPFLFGYKFASHTASLRNLRTDLINHLAKQTLF